ncbi:MAG TPA: ABC transporter substrate-binding protein [Thermoleophilaceae bacterium]
MRVRILIALALVGAMAGCQESGFDESKETQRPLKVQDAMNPLNGTKVPGQAERPAPLTADTLGDTLALGVTPVVASDVPGYMRAEARGVRVVKDSDLSGIRAATPDVILGTKEKQAAEYTDLSKIAPTILTEGDDWKLNLREHGEALGRTNDSEELLTDWDNRLARVKRAIGDRKISVTLAGGRQFGPVGKMVLEDLGIGTGTGGVEVIRLRAGEEWVGSGGLLAARAALEDVARAL